MTETHLIKRLYAHLNEVYYVFKHLPGKLLDIARRATLETWPAAFAKRARTLQELKDRLSAAMRNWGNKPGPCDCQEVNVELNELRYTSKGSRKPAVVVERALRSTRKLGHLVRERLREALQLARNLKAQTLANDLESLLQVEDGSQEELGPPRV